MYNILLPFNSFLIKNPSLIKEDNKNELKNYFKFLANKSRNKKTKNGFIFTTRVESSNNNTSINNTLVKKCTPFLFKDLTEKDLNENKMFDFLNFTDTLKQLTFCYSVADFDKCVISPKIRKNFIMFNASIVNIPQYLYTLIADISDSLSQNDEVDTIVNNIYKCLNMVIYNKTSLLHYSFKIQLILNKLASYSIIINNSSSFIKIIDSNKLPYIFLSSSKSSANKYKKYLQTNLNIYKDIKSLILNKFTISIIDIKNFKIYSKNVADIK